MIQRIKRLTAHMTNAVVLLPSFTKVLADLAHCGVAASPRNVVLQLLRTVETFASVLQRTPERKMHEWL